MERFPAPSGAGPAGPGRPGRAVALLLRPLDLAFDRLAGSRFNPLYQSGPLALVFFLLLIATGLYLFLFYKIADPHGSVVRIEGSVIGSWVRAVHRLSADLALLATAVHLLRKVAQGHTWGPRAVAWVSGVFLLLTVLLCGWTGLVMVWDVHGLEVARRGAEMIDRLPVLSEPLSRSFSGDVPVPSSFFFMNLFLHVALPLGLAATLWLHVSRLARPVLWPPRRLAWGVIALLAVFAALRPAPLAPPADLLAVAGAMPLDVFYTFWLLLASRLSPGLHLALWGVVMGLLAAVPSAVGRWNRRRARQAGQREAIGVSHVEEALCTGCTHCYRDCPYEAIAMVPRHSDQVPRRSDQSPPHSDPARPSRHADLVARVDPARCVGCGICAGSCAPMGVGPPGRGGREQLAEARARWGGDGASSIAGSVVVLACGRGIAARPQRLAVPGVSVLETGCSGSLHTAVLEDFLRRGAAGVFVLSCSPRDCSFREGAKWVEQRMFHGREADLHRRVDRRRVAYAGFSVGETAQARRAIGAFAAAVRALEIESAEDLELQRLCARTAVEEVDVHVS